MEQQRQYQYPLHNGLPVTASYGSSTGSWWAKMSFRLLSILSSIAIVGFSAFYFTNWTLGPLIMMGPPAAVAIFWDCVDAIYLCVRRDRYGVHPSACLIVDLLLFLGLGAMSGVIAFTISKLDDSGYYFTFFQDEAGEEYLHVILGFGVLATVVHLSILAMAYHELRGRRSATPQIIYVQSNPGVPVNQHAQMATLPADPPPAYSLPTQQAPSHRFQDQIEIPAPVTAPDEPLMNKV